MAPPEKESAHVEPLAISSVQPPNVPWPNRSCETSMLPGMIQMVVRIVPPCVVSHPAIVLRVNVRRLRMTLLILIGPSLLALLLWLPLRLFCGRSPRRRRPVLRPKLLILQNEPESELNCQRCTVLCR
jgi:hypothetical protein